MAFFGLRSRRLGAANPPCAVAHDEEQSAGCQGDVKPALVGLKVSDVHRAGRGDALGETVGPDNPRRARNRVDDRDQPRQSARRRIGSDGSLISLGRDRGMGVLHPWRVTRGRRTRKPGGRHTRCLPSSAALDKRTSAVRGRDPPMCGGQAGSPRDREVRLASPIRRRGSLACGRAQRTRPSAGTFRSGARANSRFSFASDPAASWRGIVRGCGAAEWGSR